MLWTIRLCLILLIAGLFLSPQIIVYAIVRLAARLWKLVLKAVTRVRMIGRRLPVSASTTEQEAS